MMKWLKILSLSVLAIWLLLVHCGSSSVANAATISVNNATDTPIPGLCDLRQAIVSHNNKAYVFPSTCAVGRVTTP